MLSRASASPLARVTQDPLVEMARLDPVMATSFVKSAMLMGGLSSGLVAVVSGALLAACWSSWALCERPLRWWLLVNCLLQLVQVSPWVVRLLMRVSLVRSRNR
ncbi:unnamed protein product [Prorocentrum cordatum]|uniref:Vesicle transport protein n=1 Tax=Prorocentrum cordatum TaxID=2364126 RepID=A0ABN9SPK5_9DINO|nr:unnamed protein product [Polarella glacialis]